MRTARISPLATAPLFSPAKQKETIVAKIFRTCIFLYSQSTDCLSRTIIRFYRLATAGKWAPLRKEQLKEMERHFEALGATLAQMDATEGTLSLMTLNAAELENRIRALGGEWKEAQIGNEPVIAILPPPVPTAEWNTLYKHLKKVFSGLNPAPSDVLITAKGPRGEPPRSSVFFTSMFQPWQFERHRLAWFLGRKYSVAAYNGRGMPGQRGRPSIEGNYDDAERAFLQAKLQLSSLWVYGNCRDNYLAMFLALKHQAHTVFETTPRSLEDGLRHQKFPGLMTRIALHSFPSLLAPHTSALKRNFPEAFDHRELLKTIPARGGNRLIFLANSRDPIAPPEEIDEVIRLGQERAPQCRYHKITVDTAKYPKTRPHAVKSWRDPETLQSLETLLLN